MTGTPDRTRPGQKEPTLVVPLTRLCMEAESAIVTQWLTSGLRVAMARTGWHLLSPRLMLTKVPECVLHDKLP